MIGLGKIPHYISGADMNAEQERKLDDLHDYFMKPSVEGKPTRAQQLDTMLTAVQSGRMSLRIVLYLLGAYVAIKAGLGDLLGGAGE